MALLAGFGHDGVGGSRAQDSRESPEELLGELKNVERRSEGATQGG